VTRAGIAALALLAYPSAARADRGEEMVATLLDASAGSRTRFARELADLVRSGLRLRTADATPARLTADGLCLAGVWLMTLDLVTLLGQRYRGMHDPLLAWPSIALLAAALAIALVGFDRVAGAAALVWTALRFPHLAGPVPEVLPALSFSAMVLAPRRRPPDVRRLAWLVVPAALVVAFGPRGNPLLLALGFTAVGIVATVALAVLTVDPRIAIAGAVPVSTIAAGFVATHGDPPALAWLTLAAGPAVIVYWHAIASLPRSAGLIR